MIQIGAAFRPERILQANRDGLRPILTMTMARAAGMIPPVFSGDAVAATNRSKGVVLV